MKTKAAASALLLFLLALAFACQVTAQTRVPGVSVGNKFTYKITTRWTSSDPSVAVPADLVDYNNTLFYNMTVSEVSGTNITTDDIWSFVNGTEKPAVVKQSIISGETYMQRGLIRIAGAGLSNESNVYPAASEQWTINQTQTFHYAGGDRETNLVVFSSSFENPTANNATVLTSYSFLFDKATGVLVEERDETYDYGYGEFSSVIVQLVNSNVWAVPGSPKPSEPFSTNTVIMAAVVGVVLVVIVVVSAFMYSTLYSGSNKNKKKRHHR